MHRLLIAAALLLFAGAGLAQTNTNAGPVTALSTVTTGVLSSHASAGVGYTTGAGCAVTQGTSKATTVTCTGMSGQVTMNAASLAASTSVGFTVTDTSIVAKDAVILSIGSGATAASYLYGIDAVAAGSFKVHLRNMSAGALAEAVVLNFAIIKAATN